MRLSLYYCVSVYLCVRLSLSDCFDFFFNAVVVGNRMLQVANERGDGTATGHQVGGRGEFIDNQPVTEGGETTETGHDAVVGES